MGNLKSASASVAAIGNNWSVADVINRETASFAESALQRVFSIKGRGYESLYEFQISPKEIVLSGSLECDGFTIFNIEIR